ncbi:MFS transporter [Bdellovibrionota bacterium FG-2]
MIYDSFEAEERNENRQGFFREILAKKFFYTQAGETVAAVLGGLLATVSLSLPAALNAVFGWVPFFIALSLIEPKRKATGAQKGSPHFKSVFGLLFNKDTGTAFLLPFFMFVSFTTYAAVWSFQGHWQHIGVSKGLFGILWAAISLTGAMVGKNASKIAVRLGTYRTMIGVVCLPILGYFLMGCIASPAVAALALIFPASRALNSILMQDMLNSKIPGHLRATVNSTASVCVRAFAALCGPAVGLSIDHQGYSSTYLLLSGFCFLGALTFGIFFMNHFKTAFASGSINPIASLKGN